MTVKEIAGKWHTVNKAGKVGKRKFSTKANAEAASARGSAMSSRIVAATTPVPDVPIVESMDTTEERKALGIPAKKGPVDPEAF